MAVFSGPALRKNLHAGDAGRPGLRVLPASPRPRAVLDARASKGRWWRSGPRARGRGPARPARALLPHKPVGSISLRGDAEVLTPLARARLRLPPRRRGARAIPPRREVLAHLEAARAREGQARRAGDTAGAACARPPRRLAILTDIVKTANSILEPRKIIELIMAKVQELIPSEAWSILMLDEEKQELTFELALGEKGKDVAVVPGQGGGGHRGLGGADGRAHHRQRHLEGPALRAALRRLHPVPDPVRALRAPHLARAHHRRGAGHQQAAAASSPRPTSSCCSPWSSPAPSPSRTRSCSSARSSSPSPTTSPASSTRAT